MSTATTTFIPWPDSSPTSRYNINVRFYNIVDESTGTAVPWDIGKDYEEAFENLYEVLLETGKTQTPREFEQFVRTLVENRLLFMTGMAVYPALLSLVLGDGDTIYNDMVRQSEMLVSLYNRFAKRTGKPLQHSLLKPKSTPLWKKLLA